MLSNPAQYLEPFCEMINNPEGCQTIIQVEEGQLQKNQDHWHLIKKARIRFE
jgi:hypothetical protein